VNPELVQKLPNNFYEQQFGFGDAESDQGEGSDDFRNMVCPPSLRFSCATNFFSSLSLSLFPCMHACRASASDAANARMPLCFPGPLGPNRRGPKP